MALARVSRNTLREQVYESLRDEIVSGGWEVGSRLPSMKQLADVFGTSINPVQMALERLEEEGYVVKSHGSGTYVADRESTAGGASVAVCLRARAHLDSELTMNMARELHRVGTSPIVVDIDEPASADLMTELARSGVEIFVLKGHSHSQFGLLEKDVFQGKTVVAVIEWEGPERKDLYRVMSDHAAAGRQVARYLWERGHRRVLLIAPGMEKIIQTAGSSSQRTGQLKAFSREWGRLGGEWAAIRSDASGVQEGELVAVEEEKLVKKLSGENACTAIFGFRDVEAAAAQRVLLEYEPELLDRVEIMGYFDTPWSRTAHPPITTVELRLDEVARRAAEIIDRVTRSEEVAEPLQIVTPTILTRGQDQ